MTRPPAHWLQQDRAMYVQQIVAEMLRKQPEYPPLTERQRETVAELNRRLEDGKNP